MCLLKRTKKKSVKGKKFNLKLLKSPLYLSYLLMVLGIASSMPTLQYYVTRFGESINLSPTENSILLAYQSILDALMRFAAGFLLDRNFLNKSQCLTVSLLVGGGGICLIPFSWGVYSCLVGLTLFTVASAGYFSTIHVLIIDQFGKHNISSSWGFMKILHGSLNFCYAVLLGHLRDQYGSFTPTFLTMGVGMLLAGLVAAAQPYIIARWPDPSLEPSLRPNPPLEASSLSLS